MSSDHRVEQPLAHLGHDPDHRQPQVPLDVLRRLDRLVEALEQEGEREAEHQAQQQADQRAAADIGLEAVTGKRRVDHGNVIGGAAASDADLLIALQQGVIELAVGVGLALQDIELHAAALQVEQFGLQ